MNIDKKLKSIIRNVANQDVDIELINANTVLTQDLKYDSIQLIELIVELEVQFEIEIDDDDLDIENLTIYKNLYEMINRKLKIELWISILQT